MATTIYSPFIHYTMKAIKLFTMCALALCASFMVSCGDDDGGGSSSSGTGHMSLSVLGETATFTHAGWYCGSPEDYDGRTYCEIDFYTFDLISAALRDDVSALPSSYSAIGVMFEVDEMVSSVPECRIPAGKYLVSGAFGMSRNEPEGKVYVEADRYNSGDLVITKDGSKYTIEIENCHLLADRTESGDTERSYAVPFKYTGTLREIPASLRFE